MPRQFSLAYLTTPGVDPVEQIKIAARAGYDYVSLRTIPMGQGGEPQVHLEHDPVLMERVRQALKDHGIKLFDIELLRVREDLPNDYRAAFEKGAELGATQVLTSVWTKDRPFAVDRYGAFCEQAAQFGLTLNLEFPIVSELTSMKEALELQDQVGASNLKILMDMIYVHKTGVTPEDIRSVDPGRFGVIHLCDWPADTAGRPDVEIVRGGRAYCGEGVVDQSVFFCFGGGGAGRAMCSVLAYHGARKIYITDLFEPCAKSLVDDINQNFAPVAEFVPHGDFSKLAACNVVLNASGIGMGRHIGETPLPKEYIQPSQFFFDACYNPERTQFLMDAEEKGCKVLNGLGMSLYQGAAQIELWTGKKPPVDAIRCESAEDFLPAMEKAIAANKAGKPFLVEAPMENIVVPTPGCWNINDIYSPNELVKEGKLVKKENGQYVAPSHSKSHNAK